MKKRAFIVAAACLLLIGCSSSNQNQAGLPSVGTNYEESANNDAPVNNEESVNNEGAVSPEDSTSWGDESGVEGNDTSPDTVTPGSNSYSGGGSNGGEDNDDDSSASPGGAVNSPKTSNNGGGANNSDSYDNSSDSVNNGDSDSEDSDKGAADETAGGEDTDGNNPDNGGSDPVDNADQQQTTDYGRIFFIGDSRTVDMFDGNVEEVYDLNVNGIRVFAKDGCHCAYMQDVTGKYAGEFDTVVSWLGCNDNNDAALYQQVYENLISQGKTVVLCTVGPTADEFLSGDFDVTNYPNEKMIAFNQSMTSWASAHGVKVIDTYSFVQGNVEISQDGIHYNPKPTTDIWNYILGNLNS